MLVSRGSDSTMRRDAGGGPAEGMGQEPELPMKEHLLPG